MTDISMNQVRMHKHYNIKLYVVYKRGCTDTPNKISKNTLSISFFSTDTCLPIDKGFMKT